MKLSKYKILTAFFLKRRWSVKQEHHLIIDKQLLSDLVGPNHSQTFSRLKSSALVENQQRFAGGQFNITSAGINDLLLRFPLLDFLDKNWDASLTLAVFNISEKNRKDRDRLRYCLKALGFGCLNRSLYLSPHFSVKEVGHVLASVADSPTRRVNRFNPSGFSSAGRSLAFSVPFDSLKSLESLSDFWDLTAVADLYERAVSYWGVSLRPGLAIADQAFEKGKFLSKFIEALLIDPLLPPSLMPKDWPGIMAHQIARKCFT